MQTHTNGSIIVDGRSEVSHSWRGSAGVEERPLCPSEMEDIQANEQNKSANMLTEQPVPSSLSVRRIGRNRLFTFPMYRAQQCLLWFRLHTIMATGLWDNTAPCNGPPTKSTFTLSATADGSSRCCGEGRKLEAGSATSVFLCSIIFRHLKFYRNH